MQLIDLLLNAAPVGGWFLDDLVSGPITVIVTLWRVNLDALPLIRYAGGLADKIGSVNRKTRIVYQWCTITWNYMLYLLQNNIPPYDSIAVTTHCDSERWVLTVVLTQTGAQRIGCLTLGLYPAITGRWSNVALMLGQRRGQWANIKPALDQRLVSAGHRPPCMRNYK